MAKKTNGSFFTKILVVSTIFLGTVLVYSYIIGNAIQPQLGVVEKIYTGIFSSADTISGENKEVKNSFNITSKLNISKNNSTIFEGDLILENAEIYANPTGLEQRISIEKLDININNNSKQYTDIINHIDIISQNENIYISSKESLENIFEYFTDGKYGEYTKLLKKVSQINNKGSYAHLNNAQPIHQALERLESDHLINQLLTALVTSNPKEYFEQNKLGNLFKQRLYNDQWIDYFFVENKKLSEENKNYFVLNPEICNEISPFLANINISGTGTTIDSTQSYKQCVKNIHEANPFIALVSQIYKYGDIENGNYDFVISQGTQIDVRLTYSNHILQSWNAFIQNPENTMKISVLGDKFGIKESQLDIDYINEKSSIKGNIVNGTGDIAIDINEKNNQTSGNIIFQKYLLVDMDVTARGETEKGKMRLKAIGDYKSGRVDYTVTQDKDMVEAINIKYTHSNYKIDYISQELNFNSLYAPEKFIVGYSQQTASGAIEKEIKYVYDQGDIKGHYRTDDFEGNLQGEILSGNNFQLGLSLKQQDQNLVLQLESNEISNEKIEYKAEGKIEDEVLFILNAQNTSSKNSSQIQANIEVPHEKIDIDFSGDIVYNTMKNTYELPQNFETIDIELNQIIAIPNIHTLLDIGGPELTFAGASIAAAGGTMSYLSLQGDTREQQNNKVKENIQIINQAIARVLSEEGFDLNTLIHQINGENKDTGVRIGGDKILPGKQYKVGSINYEILALDSNIIESDDISYMLAILEVGERKNYQILGYLEEPGSKYRVITAGNYIPREFIRYDFDIVVHEDIDTSKQQTSIEIELRDEHDLIVGDITNLGRVLDVNEKVLFIENAINPDISKVYLLGNDSPTLFIHKNKPLEENEVIIKK